MGTDVPDIDILYVGFLLGHGGDAVQMLELASGMARRGRRVKLVVPALETSLQLVERGRERGVDVERSALIRADAHASRQNPVDVIRFFAANRGHIVHIHTGDVCLPRFAVVALDLLRIPRVCVTVHSPYETLRPGEPRARFWARAVERRLWRVFCPSRHSAEAQQSYGVPAEKVQTIYNGIDVKRFACGDGAAARAGLGVAADVPLVVFSSRIESQKRPLDALAAFAAAAGRHPAARLVLVGQGTMEGQVRARAAELGIADRVVFTGYRDNVPDWLAAATVWIHPTERENFSLSVLEALAAGCPVVSTWCQGNDEVLEDGRNALVTQVGDVEAQGAALDRLLADPALRARLGAGAQAAAQRFSLETMVERYAEEYTRMEG